MLKFIKKLFELSSRQMTAVIISAVLLTTIVLRMGANIWIQIPCFAFAAYALVLFIVFIVKNYGHVVIWVKNWRVWIAVRKIPIGEKILDDALFRTKLGLYFGAVVNAAYVVIKFLNGIIYRSNWLEVLAVYYFILAVMRYVIIVYERKNGIHTDLLGEWHRYRICGMILLTMNIVLAVMVILSVYHNAYFDYPGFLIYIMAFYSFYAVSYSIPSLISFRKHGSPILSSVKVISLTAALVSMLSLEIAMTARFGGNAFKFRKVMTSLTGGVVCLVVLVMAVYMIIHATVIIKKEEKES